MLLDRDRTISLVVDGKVPRVVWVKEYIFIDPLPLRVCLRQKQKVICSERNSAMVWRPNQSSSPWQRPNLD